MASVTSDEAASTFRWMVAFSRLAMVCISSGSRRNSWARGKSLSRKYLPYSVN